MEIRDDFTLQLFHYLLGSNVYRAVEVCAGGDRSKDFHFISPGKVGRDGIMYRSNGDL